MFKDRNQTLSLFVVRSIYIAHLVWASSVSLFMCMDNHQKGSEAFSITTLLKSLLCEGGQCLILERRCSRIEIKVWNIEPSSHHIEVRL